MARYSRGESSVLTGPASKTPRWCRVPLERDNAYQGMAQHSEAFPATTKSGQSTTIYTGHRPERGVIRAVEADDIWGSTCAR